MKLVKKKVLGYSLIPKIEEMPPKIICDTEDYFKQLENLGFTIIDIDNQSTDTKPDIDNQSTDTHKVYITNESMNIKIDGGVDLRIPNETILNFDSVNDKLNQKGITIDSDIECVKTEIEDDKNIKLDNKKPNKRKNSSKKSDKTSPKNKNNK